MTVDDALEFVRTNHRAVIVTRRRSGDPLTSPVTVGADDGGNVVISTRETAYKVRHLRRDPRVTLCVFTEAFFGPWIQIDGTAEVVPLPEAMDALVEYYRRISGEHPDWDEYRQAMEREQRVLVRVAVERVGPTTSG